MNTEIGNNFNDQKGGKQYLRITCRYRTLYDSILKNS